MDAIAREIGSERIGVRISPEARIHDGPAYPSERETFLTLAAQLSERRIAYVHINDMGASEEIQRGIRQAFKGTLILCGEYTLERANQALADNRADLIAFGRPFIGNLDLVERLRNGWPLVQADHAAFYGGDDHGYIDFPAYTQS